MNKNYKVNFFISKESLNTSNSLSTIDNSYKKNVVE
jgi:hypothetical protein